MRRIISLEDYAFVHSKHSKFCTDKNTDLNTDYVAAEVTYIRLLHGKIGFFGVFSALAP